MRRPIAPLLLIPALVLGIWLGGHPETLPGFARDALVGDEKTRVVREAIEDVRDEYYRQVPTERLADAAIDGMVRALRDPFSAYFNKEQYARFRQQQDSEFTGVGIAVLEHPRGLRITDVYDGSPAERAGLKPNNVIVAAAGKSLRGLNINQSVALIKGAPGTDVKLRIRSRAGERDLTLTRATIDVPVVASRMRRAGGRDVATIKLAQFSSGAHGELRIALRRALNRGAKGIVLDLRGNGGGLVTEARLVASAFVQEGKIVTTRGRSVPTRTLSATGDPVSADEPLVVLVDRNSASAAEIVAGALQDHDRAPVVGTRTFGKGVFQEIIELSNGGALDITAGQYFTPKGRNLGPRDGKPGGSVPAVKAQDDPETKPDEALETALETLVAKL